MSNIIKVFFTVALIGVVLGLAGTVFAGGDVGKRVENMTDKTVSESDKTGATNEKDSGQNREEQGLNGLLLLIPAATLLLSFPFVSPGTRNAVLPTLGAGTTAVLSFFTKGNMPHNIFWAILIAEIILILVLDYLIVKKTVIEVLEEEEVLEKKARRAKSGKRR